VTRGQLPQRQGCQAWTAVGLYTSTLCKTLPPSLWYIWEEFIISKLFKKSTKWH